MRDQFVGDCVGGQPGDHRVDQFAERGAVRVKIGLGLGDLLVILGGLAQGVVDEEPNVLPPRSEERLLGVGIDRADGLRSATELASSALTAPTTWGSFRSPFFWTAVSSAFPASQT
ncbi:MAG TPA: hypothetical protein VI094_03610 [Propionibacteriaceae bacterium]